MAKHHHIRYSWQHGEAANLQLMTAALLQRWLPGNGSFRLLSPLSISRIQNNGTWALGEKISFSSLGEKDSKMARFSADDFYDPQSGSWSDEDAPAPKPKPKAKSKKSSAVGDALASRPSPAARKAAAAAGVHVPLPCAPPAVGDGGVVQPFAFTGPSPDELVEAARAGRVPGRAGPPKAGAAPLPVPSLGSLTLNAPSTSSDDPDFASYVPAAWESRPEGSRAALHVVCLGHVDAVSLAC